MSTVKKITLTGISILCLGALFYFFGSDQTIKENERREREEEGELPGALRAMDLWGDMRMYPYGTMRSASYSRAFEMSKQMSFSARTRMGARLHANNTAPWTDLAPKNFAGRVLSMGFHPTDPNIMWVGSAAGGLWKTTNGGTGAANGINWQYIQTGFPVLGVSSIIVGPDGNTLYIGTGELYKDPQSPTLGSGVTGSGHDRSFRGTYGIGILKSTDGGNTWTKALDFSYSNAIAVMDMAMDPNNANIIYAATTEGMYRTINAGASWSLISVTGSPRLAMDLEYKPGSSSVLYVSFGNFGTIGNGIYKSVNANDATPTFAKLTSGLPATITGKIQLAVTPAAPNNVYASIGHSPTATADAEGFYRSNNEGSTWSGPAASNIIGQQGWYAHDVAVSRTSADTIYWGELNLYRANNGTAASSVTFGIRSSWDAWNVNNTTVGTLQEGLNNGYVHADIHRILPSPHNTNTVFILTDGGVFRSTNRCETFQTLNGGLQTAQIYAKAAVSSTDPNFMLMGMQDNEGLVYAGNPGCRRVPNLGDGFHAAISPSNQNICYIASYNLRVLKSTDKAVTFNATPLAGVGSINGPVTSCFNAPFVLAPSNSSVVYGGTALLRKSTDALGTVAVIGGTTAYVSGLYSPILTMAVSHQNANRMYCSTTPSTEGTFIRSKLWRTVTTSTAFTEKTDITGTLPDRYYTDIAVDPTNDQRIAVTLSGFNSSHVFLSLNGGNSWTDIGQGLPDIPHNSVVFDPTNRDIIYVGNDQGVYYAQGVPLSGSIGSSFNLNWISYNEGLGDGVLVSDIVITNTRKLRLATYGRGLWERDMIAPASPTAFSINDASQCLNENQFQFTATSSSCSGPVTYQWNFGDGNTANGQSVNYSYTNEGNYSVKLIVSNTSGCRDSISQNITVLSSPTPPSVSTNKPPEICEGDSVTLISSAGSGNQWYRNGTLISGANAISLIAKIAGSYTCKTTGANNCISSASNTITVSLNPRPQISVNSATVCAGDSATLSVVGNADTYSWSPTTGLSPINGPVVKASPAVTTPYTVTATFNATGCQNTAQGTVTIRSRPSITSSSINPTTCGSATGSITLSGLAASTIYTLNYSKNGVPVTPVSRTSTATGTIQISSLNAATYSNISVTLNGCVSNVLGPISLSDPNPPVLTIPNNNIVVCATNPTGNISFSASPTNATINWTNTNTSIGLAASGTGSINSFNAVNNGTSVQTANLSVTATLNGCVSAVQTISIIVNPRPQISVNSASICAGDSATLSVVGNADTYSWSPTTGLFPINGPIVKASPAVTTPYSVTATFSATGCQNTAQGTVTLKPRPSITSSSINPTTCGSATGSITLSGLAASTIYTLNYSKNGVPVAPVSRTSSATGTILIPSLTSGTYADISVTLNGCISNVLGPISLSDPNPPTLTIPANNVVLCATNPTGNITFSANPANATINWTNNNTSIGLAASGTGSINSFNAVNNGTSVQTANLSVTATLNGCVSAAQSINIIVNPRPQISVNSPSVCAGDSATLTVNGNADTYSWSPTTGLFPINGPIVKASPAVTTPYSVTATFSATGCQNTAQGTVTIKSVPMKPAITLNGNQLVSSSLSGNQWFLNGVAINGATGSAWSPLQSGIYTVRVSINGCSSPLSDPYNFIFTGQNELFEKEYIQSYPNPVGSELRIRYHFNDHTQSINVRIIGSDGSLLKEIKELKTGELIKTSELPKGSFILMIETKETKRRFIYKSIKI